MVKKDLQVTDSKNMGSVKTHLHHFKEEAVEIIECFNIELQE